MEIAVGCRHWSMKLAQQWSLLNEEDCVTFTAEPDIGALQVSAREKDTAVDDDDLRAFATDRVDLGSVLEPVTVGELVGFTAVSSVDEIVWREWWLRRGHVMVYLTYNVDAARAGSEDDAVAGMMSTLRLRPDDDDEAGAPSFGLL